MKTIDERLEELRTKLAREMAMCDQITGTVFDLLQEIEELKLINVQLEPSNTDEEE